MVLTENLSNSPIIPKRQTINFLTCRQNGTRGMLNISYDQLILSLRMAFICTDSLTVTLSFHTLDCFIGDEYSADSDGVCVFLCATNFILKIYT